MWKECKSADLVYAMCPNDVGILGLLIARLSKRPAFISIDTDRAERAANRSGPIFARRLQAWIIRRTIYPLIRLLGKNLPGYVTGNPFMGHIPMWKQWIKTTVRSENLPSDTPRPSPRRGALRVIFAGRLSPEKNIEILLDASRLYAQLNGEIELIIVGDGELRSSLERKCQDNGMDYVTFTGHIPNQLLLGSRFLDADVLVLPSLEERQGKVLLEAMACSIPVIASRSGGIPSVVTHLENGILFDPRNAEDLYAALARLSEDAELREAISKRGYQFALRHTLDKGVSAIMREVRDHYGMCGLPE
jgi:glycosyltransferase involved in cell wall biosynthesis